MPTASECRQRAQECLILASAAIDFYAQEALTELASDFEEMAEAWNEGRSTRSSTRAVRSTKSKEPSRDPLGYGFVRNRTHEGSSNAPA
jgi:hypothetical protein